jgi:hypothetical protein
MRRFLLWTAACGLWTAPAAAQRMFGNVFLDDDRTPAVGAIVGVADSAGALIARELTGGRGEYVVVLPKPGKYTIVAQRIGSLPAFVRDVVVGDGADVRSRIVLSRQALRPAQVAVRSKPVCELSGDTTGLAGLWDQFQVALTSSDMAQRSKQFLANWGMTEVDLTASGRDTLAKRGYSTPLGLEFPAFPVLSADSSERFGFVLEMSDGVRYHVPGVETFRSPGFLTRRCFAFEPAPDGKPDWIGLHFIPTVARMGLSEVEGTVWFDAKSLEPRAMSFVYTGLPPNYAPARAGGALRFQRISTGHWVPDEWTLRIPSGRLQRLYAYNLDGRPNAFGNVRLDGIRAAIASITELTFNGTTVIRRP